jgi:hypothetical protein
VALGSGFGAGDVEPRTAAAKGNVHMPTGEERSHERLVATPHWAHVLGFKPVDLEVPRNRCMYSIKAALWCGQHYENNFKFKVRGEGSGDYTSSDKDHKPAETLKHLLPSKSEKITEKDKLLCNTCTLQTKCKYYGDGAVCTLPGAEPVRLAKMFNTRNADDIIDGLGTLLAANTNRLERGIQNEELDGELSSEVSKMMGQIFDQGVKLAKLLEPQRFSPGSKVQVNVGSGAVASVSSSNPRQLVSATIQELVRQGVPRDKITPEMIQGALEGMVNPDAKTKAIEGTVIDSQE